MLLLLLAESPFPGAAAAATEAESFVNTMRKESTPKQRMLTTSVVDGGSILTPQGANVVDTAINVSPSRLSRAPPRLRPGAEAAAAAAAAAAVAPGSGTFCQPPSGAKCTTHSVASIPKVSAAAAAPPLLWPLLSSPPAPPREDEDGGVFIVACAPAGRTRARCPGASLLAA